MTQNSWKHKLWHLLSDKVISSQADPFTMNPFGEYFEAYRDILVDKKFIFLQHGITKDDVSQWFNKSKRNISLFVTAAQQEYQSILNYDYRYDETIVKLTGFPRYDLLYHEEKKIVTIMPTWRASLVTGINSNTGLRELKNNFEQSHYFQMYITLLNDKRLVDAAQKYGYRLQFLPHPNMLTSMQYMKCLPQIKILDVDASYRTIFAETDLLITDYSSVAFDFAYLRKPVLYFQQDREEFLNHTYVQGYFDYEDNGFGEVCYDEEILINLIVEYMEKGCLLKGKYRQQIDNFFAYNDKDNCERVYEEILKLK